MKTLIIKSAQEIAQNPKVALVVTGGAATNGFFQWFESNISVMSGIIGLIGAIIVVVIQVRRNAREEKEHKINMKIKRKELKK